MLQIVDVAEKNGLKLPREFGLLLKQALYFDRYQKLLAPSLDPLRDARVRNAMSQEFSGPKATRILGKDEPIPKNVIDVDLL